MQGKGEALICTLLHTLTELSPEMLWGWCCTKGHPEARRGVHRQLSRTVLLQLLHHKHMYHFEGCLSIIPHQPSEALGLGSRQLEVSCSEKKVGYNPGETFKAKLN